MKSLPHKLPKTVRFPFVPYKEFSSARPAFIFEIFAFWAFISFHFGLLGFHFLSFWPCGLSFPFILAFWSFISFHFGLLGLHFVTFWPFGASFPFLFTAFISLHFGLLGLHFGFLPSIWPFEAPGEVSFTSSGHRPWGPSPQVARPPFEICIFT